MGRRRQSVEEGEGGTFLYSVIYVVTCWSMS